MELNLINKKLVMTIHQQPLDPRAEINYKTPAELVITMDNVEIIVTHKSEKVERMFSNSKSELKSIKNLTKEIKDKNINNNLDSDAKTSESINSIQNQGKMK